MAAKEKQAYPKTVTDSFKEFQGIIRGYEPQSHSQKFIKLLIFFSANVFTLSFLRMDPIYFQVPRKVQVSGLKVDGITRQYDYLVDESETISILACIYTVIQSVGTQLKIEINLTGGSTAGEKELVSPSPLQNFNSFYFLHAEYCCECFCHRKPYNKGYKRHIAIVKFLILKHIINFKTNCKKKFWLKAIQIFIQLQAIFQG